MELPESIQPRVQKLKWFWQDCIAKWRSLSPTLQGSIALGLFALMVASIFGAIYYTGGFSEKPAVQNLDKREIVIYTSVDAHIAKPILDQFEQESGITVKMVTDTEATKTTGLLERLNAERERPACDIWWSSEPVGTISLARAGLLDPAATRNERDFKTGWPTQLKATDSSWYGCAQRARVIAYNTNKLLKQQAPKTLRDLLSPNYNGRVGMARPQFGTTRTHIAALVALHGDTTTRTYLEALKANGLKLYDGNSAVVKAIADGEIDVGLTDTDDVEAGRRNKWPVDSHFETADKPNAKITGLPSVGTIVIPNTVARIKGGPNPNNSQQLFDYLLSAKLEEALANSESANIPIREDLAKKLNRPMPPTVAPLDWDETAAKLPLTDQLINAIFPIQ